MNNDRQAGAFSWKWIGGAALVILALLAGLLLVQGNSASGLLAYLPYLLILACPLMMIFMMGSMGSMDHGQSASHHHDDSVGEAAPGIPDMSGMTRDEQVWTLRNELTRMAWRQESLRQDLERLEHERTTDAGETATPR
jgi:uncharacterized membrane protein